MKLSALSALYTGSLACAASIHLEKRAGFPFIKYGEFPIVNCGSNQHEVVTLLETLQRALLPAMEDARSGRASAAYTTFFKDINYHSDVFSVLRNASTGVGPEQSLSPVFFCPTAVGQWPYYDINTGQKGDIFTKCRTHPNRVAIIAYHSRFIILCPTFFTSRVPLLPPANECLEVSSNRQRFANDGALMVQYATWILLDMLAKFYIFWSTRTEFDIVGANNCARMKARDAVRNGRNYVYYVASIYGQCSQFPNLPSGRPTEYELLSGPGNYSDVNMDGAINATFLHLSDV